jgi:hypothetical protein
LIAYKEGLLHKSNILILFDKHGIVTSGCGSKQETDMERRMGANSLADYSVFKTRSKGIFPDGVNAMMQWRATEKPTIYRGARLVQGICC